MKSQGYKFVFFSLSSPLLSSPSSTPPTPPPPAPKKIKLSLPTRLPLLLRLLLLLLPLRLLRITQHLRQIIRVHALGQIDILDILVIIIITTISRSTTIDGSTTIRTRGGGGGTTLLGLLVAAGIADVFAIQLEAPPAGAGLSGRGGGGLAFAGRAVSAPPKAPEAAILAGGGTGVGVADVEAGGVGEGVGGAGGGRGREGEGHEDGGGDGEELHFCLVFGGLFDLIGFVGFWYFKDWKDSFGGNSWTPESVLIVKKGKTG
jgi:hypothetical protein